VAHKAAKAPTPPADKAGKERAQAALGDQAWVVTLDAFSNATNVKQLRTKLSAAGVKSYTEPVKTSKGELTRVRAGPFASREAAEKARAKLDAMGLKPGAVASR
jgi:DedD protein